MKHLGIIMDGNGRWASSRGLSRINGHIEGVKTTKKIIAILAKRKLPILSLYIFSTENWQRQAAEVAGLMQLIVNHLEAELPFYYQHSIRIYHSGNRNGLPQQVIEKLDYVIEKTAAHTGTLVNLLINYGGQDEICRAVNRWRRHSNSDCTSAELQKFLDGGELIPPVDFLIRSGGEQRLSNFMLWRCSYSEFYFSNTLWPDWNEEEIDRAFAEYQQRQRRYGKEN